MRQRSVGVAIIGATVWLLHAAAARSNCRGRDPCTRSGAVRLPDGRAWRGTWAWEPSLSELMLYADAVVSREGVCQVTGTMVRVSITVRPEESTRDASGGLVVEFEDPRDQKTWMNGRPQVSVGVSHDETYSAYAASIHVTTDGEMTGTLEVAQVGLEPDGGGLLVVDAGTVRLDGPVSVPCAASERFTQVPVADGSFASIRCAIVDPEASGCDDTPSGCSIARVGARR